MLSTSIQRFLKKAGTLLTVLILSFSIGFSSAIPQAQALNVSDALVLAAQRATQAYAAAMNYLDEMVAQKELVLDYLAWNIINILIEEMTASMVRWIKSGYEGRPAFAIDMNNVLETAADQALTTYLGDIFDPDNSLGWLCSPFSVDISLKLKLIFQPITKNAGQCTLSGILKNIHDANQNITLNGERLNLRDTGGWDGWYDITLRQKNNPYGQLVRAEHDAAIRIKTAEGEEKTILGFGNGFFSQKKCEGGGQTPAASKPTPVPSTACTHASALDDPNHPCHQTDRDNMAEWERSQEKCTISTPGKIIEDQLNKELDNPRKRFHVADEVNEVISAFMQQLVMDVFSDGLSSYDVDSAPGRETKVPEDFQHPLQEEYQEYLETLGLDPHDLSGEIQFCSDPRLHAAQIDESTIICAPEAEYGSCTQEGYHWVEVPPFTEPPSGQFECWAPGLPTCSEGTVLAEIPFDRVSTTSPNQIITCIPENTDEIPVVCGGGYIPYHPAYIPGENIPPATYIPGESEWQCVATNPTCSGGLITVHSGDIGLCTTGNPECVPPENTEDPYPVPLEMGYTTNDAGISVQVASCQEPVTQANINWCEAPQEFLEITDPETGTQEFNCTEVDGSSNSNPCPEDAPALAWQVHSFGCYDFIDRVGAVCPESEKLSHIGSNVYSCNGNTFVSNEPCPSGTSLYPVGGKRFQCLSDINAVPVERICEQGIMYEERVAPGYSLLAQRHGRPDGQAASWECADSLLDIWENQDPPDRELCGTWEIDGAFTNDDNDTILIPINNRSNMYGCVQRETLYDSGSQAMLPQCPQTMGDRAYEYNRWMGVVVLPNASRHSKYRRNYPALFTCSSLDRTQTDGCNTTYGRFSSGIGQTDPVAPGIYRAIVPSALATVNTVMYQCAPIHDAWCPPEHSLIPTSFSTGRELPSSYACVPNADMPAIIRAGCGNDIPLIPVYQTRQSNTQVYMCSGNGSVQCGDGTGRLAGFEPATPPPGGSENNSGELGTEFSVECDNTEVIHTGSAEDHQEIIQRNNPDLFSDSDDDGTQSTIDGIADIPGIPPITPDGTTDDGNDGDTETLTPPTLPPDISDIIDSL